MKTESTLILLSAGGTGGHMFPAAALAQDLMARGYPVEIVTDPRGKKLGSIFGDIKTHTVRSGTLGSGITNKIKGMTALGVGMLQARRLVERIKPSLVVGFGGYPSVPSVYAAQRLNIPTLIHEQNAILGRANIFLAPKADRIALSHIHSEGLKEIDTVRAVVTGNPVRDDIAALYSKPYPALGKDGAFKIAVIGGSLGTKIFSDVIPTAFGKLSAVNKARLDITQQCREEDKERVRASYKDSGIKARLSPFFNDMPNIMEQTHLMIARSGASTVSEITTAGRPAIFVPYPHHKDQQQKINADVVSDAGGAWVIPQDEFTAEALFQKIESFLQNPEILFHAAEHSRSCAKPDATRRLGNLVTALTSGWDQ